MPDRAARVSERRLPDPRTDRPFGLPARAYATVAADWPRCDEHRIWTIADHWYAAAAAEPAAAWEHAGRAAAEVVAVLDGPAADAFAGAWADLAGAAARIPPATLHRLAAELGRLADGHARAVQAAKLRAWIELGQLAVDLLDLSVAAVLMLGEAAAPPGTLPTGPGAAEHLAAGLAAARQAFVGLDGDLVGRAAVAALRHTADLAPTPSSRPSPAAPSVDDPSPGLQAGRRDEVARHLARAAERRRGLARDAARRADEARRDPVPVPAAPFEQLGLRAEAVAADLVQRAGQLRPAGRPDDVGGSDPTGTRSRPPMEVHRSELERAVPRDADGRPLRLADPRDGHWFALLNGSGPDATRADNIAEAVLAVYDTYLLGRPRVAAPRAFDGYRHGEPDRPTGADPGACARIEAGTGGRFQGLCPDVRAVAPDEARWAVHHAFTNLGHHLLNCGHGAVAFVAVRTEGGKAHLWAAVNQHGTVLHLDAQCGTVTADGPPYGHAGRPCVDNAVLVDALVVDGSGTYAPLPFHPTGPFSGSSDVPPDGPSTVESARRAVAAAVQPHSPALADVVVGLLDRHVERPSELTAALLDPDRRDAVLRLLRTPARVAVPGPRPGGTAPAPVGLPALGGVSPVLLAELLARIRHRVAPAVLSEVERLADRVRARVGGTVIVTMRVRSVEAIVDAIERSPAHPRTAAVADVMDARLVVPDARALIVALAAARETFGGRIGSVRDTFAGPGPHRPDGPTVDLTVSVRVDEQPYAFVLRLVTLGSAVVMDLGDRVLDGSTATAAGATRRAVVATMREVIASDVEAMWAEDPR